ncbi:MAG: C25 family cysteine peptidase, partial [Planctomycetota bacterium]
MRANTRRNHLLSIALLICALFFGNDSVTLLAQAVEVTDQAADTLVVCPESLQGEMQRWVDYRTSQGHQIKVVPPVASAFGMKQLVRECQANGALRNLVLVGTARGSRPLVPVDLRLAQVNFFFGSELDIATDNSYVDTDQDGDPDLAMGRIPVSTPEELRTYIDRVIRYENDQPQTTWRRRINIIAGVGGFGGVADKTIENTVKILLGD